jgi:lipopolysaccharide export system protein LptA
MDGQASEIHYSDDKRLIVFAGTPKATTTEALLNSGPGSTLRAGSIDILLAAKDNTVERMRAVRNVNVVEGNNTVTGGASLDYTAVDEKYVISGAPARPVTAVTRENSGCRQFIGDTIEIYKGKDTITVDGNARRQATTAPTKTQCTPSPR